MMLEAKDIHKVYKNGKKSLEVLKGIDLSVDRGKFVAIVGPSGAGKSTLLHILGGLDSPTKGKVIFKEEDIYSLPDAEMSAIRNIRIGFVFQFYHLLPEFTALENVLLPALVNENASDMENLKFQAAAFFRGHRPSWDLFPTSTQIIFLQSFRRKGGLFFLQ